MCKISLYTFPVIAASPTHPPTPILPTPPPHLTPYHVIQEQHKEPSGFQTQTTLSAHDTHCEVNVPLSNNNDKKIDICDYLRLNGFCDRANLIHFQQETVTGFFLHSHFDA